MIFKHGARFGAVGLVTVLLAVVPSAANVIPVGGPCTLIDAVYAANTDGAVGGCPAGSGPDTLTLSGDVTLVAVEATTPPFGDSGLPVVTSEITIEGNGFVIQRDPAAPDFRIALISPSGDLTVRNAHVRNGRATGVGSAGRGGGFFVRRGAVLRFVDSTASAHYGASRGGAITAGDGSGFQADAIVLVDHSTFSGNVASHGAGIATDGISRLTVDDSTFSGNHANTAGGGVSVQFSDVVIRGTTFADNTADYGGGGLSSGEGGTTLLQNVTVSGNSAAIRGGGIEAAFTHSVILEHVTVIDNDSSDGSGWWVEDGPDQATLTATGSLVAGNGGSPNCGGRPTVDGGSNFDDDASCGAGFAPIVVGLDVAASLADNGGPTETHALFADSPAIDAAGACGLATDQRGVPRDDGACDSGAFEYAEPLLVTMESLSAVETPAGVLVRWTTATEIDTVGFRLLREVPATRGKRPVLEEIGPLVPATGVGLGGADYEVLDRARLGARPRRYFVEDVDLYGRVTLHGPIEVERPGRVRHRKR